MTSYDFKIVSIFVVFLLTVPVRADRVCVTDDSGTVCQDKLTTGTIAAIVLTVILVLTLIGGAIGFFFYRRRRLAAAKAAIAANAYVIDAAQLKGAVPVTTYAPKYDPHSAPHGVVGLPTKPGSAGATLSAGGKSPQTAPTTYGGVTFPYSSPKGTAPRSQSAFSGTYTTMTGLGSGGKGSAPAAV